MKAYKCFQILYKQQYYKEIQEATNGVQEFFMWDSVQKV